MPDRRTLCIADGEIVMKEGDGRMKIERMAQIETNDIQIGDRIHVGKYTATCQEIMSKGAAFHFDQYINTSGDLQNALQSEEVLNIFKDIREHMVPFDNGDLLKAPFGYGWSGWDSYSRIRFRPVFLISLRKEDTTKKSAHENEETIQDVLDTFNEKQRHVLYYIENEETILDVLNTFNEKQRLVLNYLVKKAATRHCTGEDDNSNNGQGETGKNRRFQGSARFF